MEERKVYLVKVDTGGSCHTFNTEVEDIFYSFRNGNETMIMFATVDGVTVAIPSRFMITHEEIRPTTERF